MDYLSLDWKHFMENFYKIISNQLTLYVFIYVDSCCWRCSLLLQWSFIIANKIYICSKTNNFIIYIEHIIDPHNLIIDMNYGWILFKQSWSEFWNQKLPCTSLSAATLTPTRQCYIKPLDTDLNYNISSLNLYISVCACTYQESD